LTLLGSHTRRAHDGVRAAGRHVPPPRPITETRAAEFRLARPLGDGGDLHPGDPGSRSRLLPAGTTVGGVVVFLNTGAYTWDTRSHHNGRFPANGFLLWDGCLLPL
jgi:diaminopimelate decarboxylase